MSNSEEHCPLCQGANEHVLWQSEHVRVIAVADSEYVGFCRVIWASHVSEMSDLNEDQRTMLMRVVFVVESGLREFLRPTKINLASLGNMVPHLHWHVIPRFNDDPTFPAAIWAPPQRPATSVREFDPARFQAWLKDQLRAEVSR